MEGVEGLEGVRTSVEDGEWRLSEALSWQSALATSAVAAAETVRSAVSAARIANSAKSAAESAAFAAQKHCSASFSTPDEAKATQTRASISHSHAIHAAVIEHEAFGAKRRAAMALAHDVTCWNIQRRREMLDMLKSCARNQEEAAKKARHAWGVLRDGMYSVTPSETAPEERGELLLSHLNGGIHDIGGNTRSTRITKIVPVEHKALGPSPLAVSSVSDRSISPPLHRPSFTSMSSPRKRDALSPVSIRSVNSDGSDKYSSSVTTEDNDVMTASMQSLVDGLMTWGGRFDAQDDLSLPSGMAVTIALEESGILEPVDSRVGQIDEGPPLRL